MKARWLLMMVIFCMKLGMVCYADETEPDGVWTYVSASIPYELEGMQNPPERAVLALKDDVTGLALTVASPAGKKKQKAFYLIGSKKTPRYPFRMPGSFLP